VSKPTYYRKLALAGFLVAASAMAADAVRAVFTETPPEAVKADRLADPVDAHVHRETLAVLPELRKKPAPFTKLSIPEPQQLPRLITLRDPQPDLDPPASAPTPPRPLLPVAGAKP